MTLTGEACKELRTSPDEQKKLDTDATRRALLVIATLFLDRVRRFWPRGGQQHGTASPSRTRLHPPACRQVRHASMRASPHHRSLHAQDEDVHRVFPITSSDLLSLPPRSLALPSPIRPTPPGLSQLP